MEKPLISGESSGNGGRRREPHNRSDAIAHGSSYQKAAALVDLAEDGIGLPEQILDQSNFQSAAKFYFLFTQFDIIWSLTYFALIILNFLEKPLWCTNYSTDSCNDREYYYLGELPYLSVEESLIYEVAFLLILVADILVYALYLSPVAFDYLPLRIAPYIRVVFFMLNFRELRSTIFILAGMLGTYLNVLALGLLFLLFSSWVAYVMFEDTQQGKTVFTSYGTTLYQMFILFTTSNNPDVWIPAYKPAAGIKSSLKKESPGPSDPPPNINDAIVGSGVRESRLESSEVAPRRPLEDSEPSIVPPVALEVTALNNPGTDMEEGEVDGDSYSDEEEGSDLAAGEVRLDLARLCLRFRMRLCK
ncbi:two pore calcium channel protein 1A-like isoform X6 [Fagus crenata]